MSKKLTDDEVRQWLFAIGALMMDGTGKDRKRGETEDGDQRLKGVMNALIMATWGLIPPKKATVEFRVIEGGKKD